MASSLSSNAARAARAASSKALKSALDVEPAFPQLYGKGSSRNYLLTDPPKTQTRALVPQEFIFLAILTAVALVVRCKDLTLPNSVVFDEVHFGGFARKYIRGEFFMDVHPPLTKMLFAAVGSWAGYDGEFPFEKIGDKFPEGVDFPYYMRLFSALLGVGTVILSYLTLRSSGCRPVVCALTSLLLLIENANVTISRYILLDSPLIFFIAAAIYSQKKFEIQKPFLFSWFTSLLATGVLLGLALSLKWVGLFTVAWVGISTVYHLWFVVGDLSVSPKKILAHFFFRAVGLLAVPLALYAVFFHVHFNVLTKEGDGSAFMTSAFRKTLEGNKIPVDIVGNVGLGSIVTIKQKNTQSGYLHSHNSFYPTGSKQQQITLYPHLDSNNHWLIEPYNLTLQVTDDKFVPLTNNMKIRLKHINTGRRLHSHDEKPPVSERDWEKEVSCYGHEGFEGDYNDDFIVEIVEGSSEDDATDVVKAIRTTFRLKHAIMNHYLFAGENKLPDWGFEQHEVTCALQGKRSLTEWYIETNENPKLAASDVEIINYKDLSFWDKFLELNARMWTTNQGLTGHHNWQLSPQDWPLLLRGINYWAKDHKHVYFIGNAPVWWLLTGAVLVFVVYVGVEVLKWQSGHAVAQDKNLYNFNSQVFLYVLGWLLHYAPFFIMGRQLFLHHYLPAAYFGLLALGHFFEVLVSYIGSKYRALKVVSYTILLISFVSAIWFYLRYSPLIYGDRWTVNQCLALKHLNWDFTCEHYFLNYSQYDTFEIGGAESGSSKEAPQQNVELEEIQPENEAKETPFVADEKIPQKEEQSTEGKEQKPVAEDSPDQVVPQFEVEGTKKEAEKQPEVESAAEKVVDDAVPEDAPVAEQVVLQAPEEKAPSPDSPVEYVDEVNPDDVEK